MTRGNALVGGERAGEREDTAREERGDRTKSPGEFLRTEFVTTAHDAGTAWRPQKMKEILVVRLREVPQMTKPQLPVALRKTHLLEENPVRTLEESPVWSPC